MDYEASSGAPRRLRAEGLPRLADLERRCVASARLRSSVGPRSRLVLQRYLAWAASGVLAAMEQALREMCGGGGTRTSRATIIYVAAQREIAICTVARRADLHLGYVPTMPAVDPGAEIPGMWVFSDAFNHARGSPASQ